MDNFYYDRYNEDVDDNQYSLNSFQFNDSFEELRNYSFNNIEEDGKANNSFRVDISNRNTLPTLTQNYIKENIIEYYISNQNKNENQNVYIKIDSNENDIIENRPKNKKEKKMLGRKKKDSEESGKHDKYSEDNIIRKIKSTLLNYLRIFINSVIYKKYNGKIGEGIFRKEILKMNQDQVIIGKHDKQLINRTLKDIFSNEISKKYSTFNPNHNKKLIQFLLNEVDEEKRIAFENLFSLTFMDALNHFSEIMPLPILNGMKLLKDLCKKYENDQNYVNLLKYYTSNFENTIKIKRNRNRSKKK